MKTLKKPTLNYLTDKQIMAAAKAANIDYALKKELIKFAWLIVEKQNESEAKETNATAL